MLEGCVANCNCVLGEYADIFAIVTVGDVKIFITGSKG